MSAATAATLPNSARDSLLASSLHNVEAVTWFDPIGNFMNRGKLFEAGANYAEGGVQPISPTYFTIVGPHVLAGRTFIPADTESTTRSIVLSEALAGQLFPNGANPVGSTIKFSDSAYVVIGVVSRYSDFPEWRSAAWALGNKRQAGP